jgi:hypothetical protein
MKCQHPYKHPTNTTRKRRTDDTPETYEDIIGDDIESDTCEEDIHLCPWASACREDLKIDLHQKVENQKRCRIQKYPPRHLVSCAKECQSQRIAKKDEKAGHHESYDSKKLITKGMDCDDFFVFSSLHEIRKYWHQEKDSWQQKQKWNTCHREIDIVNTVCSGTEHTRDHETIYLPEESTDIGRKHDKYSVFEDMPIVDL